MNKQLYKESDVQKAKIALLADTNMVDYAMDIHESLYGAGSAPQTMMDQREEVRYQTLGGTTVLIETLPMRLLYFS